MIQIGSHPPTRDPTPPHASTLLQRYNTARLIFTLYLLSLTLQDEVCCDGYGVRCWCSGLRGPKVRDDRRYPSMYAPWSVVSKAVFYNCTVLDLICRGYSVTTRVHVQERCRTWTMGLCWKDFGRHTLSTSAPFSYLLFCGHCLLPCLERLYHKKTLLRVWRNIHIALQSLSMRLVSSGRCRLAHVSLESQLHGQESAHYSRAFVRCCCDACLATLEISRA